MQHSHVNTLFYLTTLQCKQIPNVSMETLDISTHTQKKKGSLMINWSLIPSQPWRLYQCKISKKRKKIKFVLHTNIVCNHTTVISNQIYRLSSMQRQSISADGTQVFSLVANLNVCPCECDRTETGLVFCTQCHCTTIKSVQWNFLYETTLTGEVSDIWMPPWGDQYGSIFQQY